MGRRQRARSVVLFIGDGLGPAQVALARYCRPAARAGLALDRLAVWGQVVTHSASSVVTDSAAAGTAWATGVKTRNGAISVDPVTDAPLPTILQLARDAGKATGLVATSRITYATPAVHAAHVAQRAWEGPNDTAAAQVAIASIAEQYLANRVDVLLGGGRDRFSPALLAEAAGRGYGLAQTTAELEKAQQARLLGLFAADHMAYECQRPASEPSLAAMTSAALRCLRRSPAGYFLMVEGSRIDHAAHENNAETMLGDIFAFDAAIAVALAEADSETLIIVTADHETGGLTLLDGAAPGNGLPVQSLTTPHGPVQLAWSTLSHTAQPVPVGARGPGAAAFGAWLDNTDLFHHMCRAMGLA